MDQTPNGSAHMLNDIQGRTYSTVTSRDPRTSDASDSDKQLYATSMSDIHRGRVAREKTISARPLHDRRSNIDLAES